VAEQKTCPACDGLGYFGTPGRIGHEWRCLNCAGTGKADGFGSTAYHSSERARWDADHAAGVKEGS
jgi:RecJ-like exonuclease